MEYKGNHRDIKFVNTKKKELVPEYNYYATERFYEYLLAIKMRKTKAFINKSACLGLSTRMSYTNKN